jgi:hypothetical protein
MAVYTLHLWPPLGPADAPRGSQAEHYTGSAQQGRLRARWTEHALGRGARMLAVHVERGGKWVVAKVEPGGRAREKQLKVQGGASRRCGVCKAEQAYQAGRITLADALMKSGWAQANEYERSTLLEIFGAEAVPEGIPVREAKPEPRVITPAPLAQPAPEVSAEMEQLVDELIAGWREEAGLPPGRGAVRSTPEPSRQAVPFAEPHTEPQAEMEAG